MTLFRSVQLLFKSGQSILNIPAWVNCCWKISSVNSHRVLGREWTILKGRKIFFFIKKLNIITYLLIAVVICQRDMRILVCNTHHLLSHITSTFLPLIKHNISTEAHKQKVWKLRDKVPYILHQTETFHHLAIDANLFANFHSKLLSSTTTKNYANSKQLQP